MHVLVIGGTRFVGYHLVWRLLAAGHRVTVVNRGTIADPFGDAIERLRADRTTPAFDAVMSGKRFDAVVDFAAYTPRDVHGLFRALRDRMHHYVFISTGQVYLVRSDCPALAREEDYHGPLMPQPRNPGDLENYRYGVEKRAAEDVLAAAFAERGFPYTSLRLPMVHGERDHLRRLESYAWRLMDGGPVLLPEGGEQRLRHVSAAAVVKCIVGLLGNADTYGQAYNLAQDETPSLAMVVRMLSSYLGATAPILPVESALLREAGLDPVAVSPLSDPWMSALDATRAKTDLGFTHEPVRAYVERFAAALLANPPADRPAGYRRRAEELRLAARGPAAA